MDGTNKNMKCLKMQNSKQCENSEKWTLIKLSQYHIHSLFKKKIVMASQLFEFFFFNANYSHTKPKFDV